MGPFESLMLLYGDDIIDQPEFKKNAWSWYWAPTLDAGGFFWHAGGCIGWLIFEATVDETVAKSFFFFGHFEDLIDPENCKPSLALRVLIAGKRVWALDWLRKWHQNFIVLHTNPASKKHQTSIKNNKITA